MNVKKILSDLVEFNTVNDKENSKINQYFRDFLEPLGFKCRRLHKCLVAEIGENPKIGFMCHTDTVVVSDGYKTDPFVLTKKGRRLYGLGASDMKGGTAAMLVAIKKIRPKDLTIYFTNDEEVGITGIKDLIDNGENFPQLIILPEPTDMTACAHGKGMVEIKIHVNGKKAHSSRPDEGKNAIYGAMKIIAEIQKFGKSLQKEKANIFTVPYTTFNVGMINGGDQVNAVAGFCDFTVDFRTIKPEHHEMIIKFITKVTNQNDATFKMQQVFARTPKENIYDTNFFINITKQPISGASGLCDGSFIASDKRVCIELGPEKTSMHQPNEYVTEQSLNKCVDIYQQIIKKYD